MTINDTGDGSQAVLRTVPEEARWYLEVMPPGGSEAISVAEGELDGPLTPESKEQVQREAAHQLARAGYGAATANADWTWAGADASSQDPVTEYRWAMAILEPGQEPTTQAPPPGHEPAPSPEEDQPSPSAAQAVQAAPLAGQDPGPAPAPGGGQAAPSA